MHTVSSAGGAPCGWLGAAILNLVLTLCFYFPGMNHAFAVVIEAKADRRAERMARQIAAASGNVAALPPFRRKRHILPIIVAIGPHAVSVE